MTFSATNGLASRPRNSALAAESEAILIQSTTIDRALPTGLRHHRLDIALQGVCHLWLEAPLALAVHLEPAAQPVGHGGLAFRAAAHEMLDRVEAASVHSTRFVRLTGAAPARGWAPMPAGMTMADYAHRGAYPLIATALLAALFVLVTLRPGSDTARMPTIRKLVLLWIGQNIILVASSMLRTVDYIEAYSLTWLRIAALIWMALVGFGLATICWRLLRNRSAAWLINMNMAAAGLLLAVVSFVDLSEIAAQWNVRHAREVGGRGVALDLCYLDGLGDSALLPLLELEQQPNLTPVFRERIQAVRARRLYELAVGQRRGWTLLGQKRLEEAQRIMVHLAPARLASGARGCSGALIPPTWPPQTGGEDIGALPALTGEIGK